VSNSWDEANDSGDALLLEERVRTASKLGESQFREYKSALAGRPGEKALRPRKDIAKDICSTLVGFANADGGELLVGVEDDGTLTGLGEADHGAIEYLMGCYRDGVHHSTPLAGVRTARCRMEGLDILYFAIPKSTTSIHFTSDGRCLQRRDLETVPISADEIKYGREEKASREYDRLFLEGARTDSLDLKAVRVLAEQLSSGMSPEKCLQHLDLADFSSGYLRLRRAALLLFATEPAHWHPRLEIRVIRVIGNTLQAGAAYNVASDRRIAGNLVTLIEKAWDELRPHLVQQRLTGSARFENRVMFPELACRETLINAIAHRDYSQEGRGIEIFVFDDRMEVISPGSLLSTVSIENLKRLEGAHESRNSFVSRVLSELGYMREVGEGMRRMFELMRSNELAVVGQFEFRYL